MLRNKSIQVFDTQNIEKGDIISYVVRGYGDEGEKEDGLVVNAIILNCTETLLKTIDQFDVTDIDIKDIENDSYRIIGHGKSLNNLNFS